MTKITFKTLKQEIFSMEFEDSTTIGEIKTQIEYERSYGPNSLKLIYNGRILANDRTVESCELKENSFIVAMVSKPPAAKSAAAASASTTATPSNSESAVPATPASQTSSTPTTAPAAPSAPSAAAPEPLVFGNTTSFLGGDQLSSTITNMMEMGYTQEQCSKAMRAAFNNPDRAVEYLLNGIPAHLNQALPSATSAVADRAVANQTPATPTPARIATDSVGPVSGAPGNLFEAAAAAAATSRTEIGGAAGRDLSSFSTPEGAAELRRVVQMVQQNPELLEPFLEQLGITNPALANQIAANPDMFIRYLTEGEDADGGDGMQENDDGVQYIDISPEEEEAINRLVALGFHKDKCVQAYIACDKNEELAANYLFSVMDDE